VRNVRGVTARADDQYQPWQQLLLAETDIGPRSARGAAELRARQITEALRRLEEHDWLRIPRQPGVKLRMYGFGPDGKTTWQLQTEASNPDVHPDYLAPNTTRGTFRPTRVLHQSMVIRSHRYRDRRLPHSDLSALVLP
jgi:hypothetical protein